MAQVGCNGIQLEEAVSVVGSNGSAHLWIMHVLDVRAIFFAYIAAMYVMKAVSCICDEWASPLVMHMHEIK